ncbi:hypothetical protein GCM10009814_14610 [Lapillicoccus jejuensis]
MRVKEPDECSVVVHGALQMPVGTDVDPMARSLCEVEAACGQPEISRGVSELQHALPKQIHSMPHLRQALDVKIAGTPK